MPSIWFRWCWILPAPLFLRRSPKGVGPAGNVLGHPFFPPCGYRRSTPDCCHGQFVIVGLYDTSTYCVVQYHSPWRHRLWYRPHRHITPWVILSIWLIGISLCYPLHWHWLSAQLLIPHPVHSGLPLSISVHQWTSDPPSSPTLHHHSLLLPLWCSPIIL